ncbi:hypothetical protein Tco_0238406 [Tanacetum coccineum]
MNMIGTVSNSFAAVLKSGPVNHNTVTESSPAIVLDDACIMKRDFSCSLMGKMKDINALSNRFIILANEGFENVKLFYLGGQWVLLELDSVTSKEKITNHGQLHWICVKEQEAWMPEFKTVMKDDTSSDEESEGI